MTQEFDDQGLDLVDFGKFLWGSAQRVSSRRALIGSGVLMALLEPLSLFSLAPFLSFAFDPKSIEEHVLFTFAYENGWELTPSEFFSYFGYITIFCLISLNSVILFHAWATARFSYGVGVDISHQLLEGHLKSPRSSYDHLQPNNVLKNVMAESIRSVEWFIQPAIQAFFRLVSLVLMSAALIVYSPVFGSLLLLVVLSMYFLIYRVLRVWLVSLGDRVANLITRRQRLVSTIALHGDELQSLRASALFLGRQHLIADQDASLKARSALFSFMPKLLVEGGALAGVCALALMFSDVASSETAAPLGLAAVFALFVYRAMPAAQGIYYGVSRARFNMTACTELYRAIATYESLTRRRRKAELDYEVNEAYSRSDFEISNLSYVVPGKENKQILFDMNFVGTHSLMTAITGPSGSGKSTLLRIMGGIEPYTSGKLFIKGPPITENNRCDVVNVFQSPSVFDDSLWFNVTLLDWSEAGSDAVDFAQRVLRLVELDESGFTELTKNIGKGGRELSGGEAQRLCIARALFSKPAILLLDEATSALDEALEKRVLTNLKEYCLSNGIKIYMIAHRKTAIDFADDKINIIGGTVA